MYLSRGKTGLGSLTSNLENGNTKLDTLYDTL